MESSGSNRRLDMFDLVLPETMMEGEEGAYTNNTLQGQPDN